MLRLVILAALCAVMGDCSRKAMVSPAEWESWRLTSAALVQP